MGREIGVGIMLSRCLGRHNRRFPRIAGTVSAGNSAVPMAQVINTLAIALVIDHRSCRWIGQKAGQDYADKLKPETAT